MRSRSSVPLRITDLGATLVAAASACALASSALAAQVQPRNVSPPVVSAPVQEGLTQTITVAAGTWSGKNRRYTYTWLRCDTGGSACAPIPHATATTGLESDTYTLAPADAGHRLKVLVTASNSGGSGTAETHLSDPIPLAGLALPPGGQGTIHRYSVYSPAVGRPQTVYVYLPPGYRQAATRRRYPVLYLLHGFPGGPGSFIDGVPAGDVQDQLLAAHRIKPLILVMPLGTPDPQTDTSWVNGPLGKWETFVASDVVHWTDVCFNTNPTPAGRGVAGLSDGAFGALNMLLHNPSRFSLAESWAGYMQADPGATAIYGNDAHLLAYNSPALQLPAAAARLRRARAYVWAYVGRDDSAYAQNVQFGAQLAALHIRHSLTIVPGSHLASVYRANLPAALQAASSLLSATGPMPARRPTPTTCAP